MIPVGGVMEWKDVMVLHAVIWRQARRVYNTNHREKHEQKLLDAFKAKNNKNYIEAYVEQNKDFQDTVTDMAKKACTYAEMELEEFNKS